MNFWTLLDTIITSPAWFVGYFCKSYRSAFNRGGESYDKNFVHYRSKE